MWASREAFDAACLRSHKALCICHGDLANCEGYLNAEPLIRERRVQREEVKAQ